MLERDMDRYGISELRQYYGALLSERQDEMLRLHYDEDISYGELAEMFSISRQAAFDAVKKGASALQCFEEKLQILKRDGKIVETLSAAEDAARKGESVLSVILINEVKKLLEE